MPPFEPKKGTGMPMDLPPGGPGGAPKVGGGMGMPPEIPGAEAKEGPSIAKVKDLLQQAMDMLSDLGANEGAEVGGGLGAPLPEMERRPPMKPRPSAGPGPMGMM